MEEEIIYVFDWNFLWGILLGVAVSSVIFFIWTKKKVSDAKGLKRLEKVHRETDKKKQTPPFSDFGTEKKAEGEISANKVNGEAYQGEGNVQKTGE